MSHRTGMQTDVIRILGTPVSHYDIIQEGPFATVARAWTSIKNGAPEWVVVKSATTQRKFAREPHDIVKELRLLSTMVHRNIVCILGSFRDEDQSLLSIYMPYLPLSLATLLASPRFSPHPFPPMHSKSSPISRHHLSTSPSTVSPELQAIKFTLVAKSMLAQTLAALSFLHDPIRRVGHRDIKPENIMLTSDGCVKIIDFGVAWKEREHDESKGQDLWPEYKGKLYFEVSTRAYRAPELLFGSRHYDHLAIDLWSLGATFAEFFMPLRLHGDEDDAGEDDDDDEFIQEEEIKSPFMVPRYLRIGYPGAQWKRESLFDGQRGEIGLAWSIFKIFGTPDDSNWPDFKSLPGASSVVFKVVSAVPLRPLLANMPPSTLIDPTTVKLTNTSNRPTSPGANQQKNSEAPSYVPSSADLQDTDDTSSTVTTMDTASIISSSEGEQEVPIIIDLLRRFLVYPAESRLRAEDALSHPWFMERLDGRLLRTSSPNSLTPSKLPPDVDPKKDETLTHVGAITSPMADELITPVNTANEEDDTDTEAPLLLLPPGYTLDKGPSSLRSISAVAWCGISLADMLRDIAGETGGAA